MNYECKKAFISMQNKMYRYAETITDEEYRRLTSYDRVNFSEKYVTTIENTYVFTPISDLINTDYTDTSNDTSFGGGDFGGGGASGDW